jgi:Fur family ferric uptake transcriptional regulator/Fur family peroxide stress response transcriptional regulator
LEHLTHPTADIIFNDLYPTVPTLSKTTVYNTLKLLEGQGAIQAIHIDEKNQRFDADISHHAHFKCKHCGAIHDLPFKKNSFEIENTGEFILTEFQVYYKGYCEQCKDINIPNMS